MKTARAKRSWLPGSLAASGRRTVGEPQFSVVLAFFNLAALAALIVAVQMISICILLHPEAGAARYVSDGVSLALKAAAASATVLSLAQVIPGPARWREVRQRAGIVNLVVLWPIVFVLSLTAYLELPAGLHTCP